jgi:hypothetical protein
MTHAQLRQCRPGDVVDVAFRDFRARGELVALSGDPERPVAEVALPRHLVDAFNRDTRAGTITYSASRAGVYLFAGAYVLAPPHVPEDA